MNLLSQSKRERNDLKLAKTKKAQKSKYMWHSWSKG